MRYSRVALLVILVTLVVGCGTTYVYYGQIRAENSEGEQAEHLVYWRKTVRPLWFDECDGSIRLLTCRRSLEKISFDETEDGIIFRQTGNHKGVSSPVAINEPCGRILNAKKISELGEGPLMLVIYCTYDYQPFTSGEHSYLKAREEPYEFPIQRKNSSEFPDGAPKAPECD
jgi:hypothetical protein